jgi:REP element-mobilizing transposase RayT
MILGAHLIVSCYGFWLPNDPRGSWSDFVRSWELFRYGPPTKVDTRDSVAHVAHDRELREAAKAALMYPPVVFNGIQARAVGTAFAEMVRKSGYKIYACSILNDHSHLVLGRHHYDFMQVMNLLKGAASKRLQVEGIHPLANFPKSDGSLPSPWASQGWKVYIDSVKQMRAAIEYVEKNPEKEGKPRQKWNCVTPYNVVPPGRR